jgi:hypothetical protein
VALVWVRSRRSPFQGSKSHATQGRKAGSPDRRFKANKGSAGCMFMIAALGVASLALLAAGGAAAGLLF